MTSDAIGPLGRRFVVGFALVSLLTVALVAAAGLVGSERGLASQDDARRQAVAERTAAAVVAAYDEAGGWVGADLGQAAAVARGGGGLLTVRAAGGRVLWSDDGRRGGRFDGPFDGPRDRMGGMMRDGRMMDLTDTATAPVVVDGATVGSVRVAFPTMGDRPGRPVAWAWIMVAALAALAAAVAAGWLVVRQLTRPVAALTEAAHSFAAGERDTVVRERGVGELGALADAFEQAVAAVRRAEAGRSQMAADVAHELRTPLAALQAGLEELRDGLAPADAAALARLHDQALRVGRIVGDLDALFAAEGSVREVRRDPVDLAEVAAREVEARSAQLRGAGLEVRVEAPVPVVVLGDRERLHQVVGNLLQNCVQHCRPGDAVAVTVRGAGARADLVVADSGPGIAPEDLPHVFERFWRGPGQDATSGSGLGLPVVHSLVRAQQGEVVVDSDGRSGTTVTVSLPLAVQPAVTGGASVAPAG
ncbi:MAG TPA: HAMP domain-containing sensor histidine kinase [Nocardioides sp.]|nr:HAMP domain-containing sensor histidine kinase [Nocardioides sp.]